MASIVSCFALDDLGTHRPTRGQNPGHREILRHGIASHPPKPNENRQSALSRRGTVLLNARRR